MIHEVEDPLLNEKDTCGNTVDIESGEEEEAHEHAMEIGKHSSDHSNSGDDDATGAIGRVDLGRWTHTMAANLDRVGETPSLSLSHPNVPSIIANSMGIYL